MTKMTKKTAFAIAQEALSTIETAEATEAWNVIQKEIERLERNALKAKSGERKLTKAQREVAEFREAVMEALAEKIKPVQCGELAKEMNVSGQKMSAALRKLVEEGRVVKTTGPKKVSLFAVAEQVEVIETEFVEEVEG